MTEKPYSGEKAGFERIIKMEKIRVTVWYEYTQESGYLCENSMRQFFSDEDRDRFSEMLKRSSQEIHSVYPEGLMHPVIEALRNEPDMEVVYTTLYEPGFGLSDELLDNTDVLIWWAHISHDRIPDELADRIVERVQRGMGFIALHSAHKSKPFTKLMGTSGCLKWRTGDFCRVWNVDPTHPIAEGIPEYLELTEEEMYGEVFDVPKPDDIVFMSWFSGGEVFRSGCTWKRGNGKVFYFQPGHETNPSYNDPYILRIITNAVRWASPHLWRSDLDCPNIVESPEAKRSKGEF